MSFGGVFGNQAIGGLAVRSVNISLMAQMLQQQQVAGAAMVEMVEGSTPRSGSPAPPPPPTDGPPPPPPQGAPEPGKGSIVDVSA